MDTVHDIIDRDLTLYLPEKTATTRLLFEKSPDPFMRKAYQEMALAKNAIYPIKDIPKVNK